MEAGFDGVQILANYLYLISQFLNLRCDCLLSEAIQEQDGRARYFELSFLTAPGSMQGGRSHFIC